MAVSGGFGGAAGRISFDNKDLADIGITAFAVGQFAVGVKGEFLLGQQVGTGFFLGLTDLGCFRCTGKHNLQCIQILVKITNDFFIDNLACGTGSVLVVQFGLGLAFKTRVRMLDGDDSCHTVSDISTGKIAVFLFQNAYFTGVSVHNGRES